MNRGVLQWRLNYKSGARVDALAGDEPGILGAEKRDHARDIDRLRQPAERRALQPHLRERPRGEADLRAFFVVDLMPHRRLDRCRTDAVPFRGCRCIPIAKSRHEGDLSKSDQQDRNGSTIGFGLGRRRIFLLEYDPEKWRPVFGKDHAQTQNLDPDPIQSKWIRV